MGAHSHFPGWRFNHLIYQNISFCINGWWFNEINGLYDGPGKWECALLMVSVCEIPKNICVATYWD